MSYSLVLHPDCSCAAIEAIDVVVERHAGKMVLQYALQGVIDDVAVPVAVPTGRADGLWQYTCCEAFLMPSNGTAYYEFNFSPSTRWAAYRFDAYRAGMNAASVVTPVITMRAESERLLLEASLEIAELSTSAWRVGLSAVIEERNGRKSYWALAHTAGKPDFHRAESFSLQLAAV